MPRCREGMLFRAVLGRSDRPEWQGRCGWGGGGGTASAVVLRGRQRQMARGPVIVARRRRSRAGVPRAFAPMRRIPRDDDDDDDGG
jgi:shikimate 5-dehydrogenase